MPRWRPKYKDGQQDNELEESPLELLRKKAFRLLNSRLGRPAAAVVVAIVVVGAQWDAISRISAIDWALTKVHQLLPLPKARGDRFAIVILRLENDDDGTQRRLISNALLRQFPNEVEVLLVDRSIAIERSERPQDAVKLGHEYARDLLRQIGASVMIWGEAVDGKSGSRLSLHWTLNADGAPVKSQSSLDKYLLPEKYYDLPNLFPRDLLDVLGLLVSSEAAAFNSKQGSYVADRLPGFIDKVRRLVGSSIFAGVHRAALEAILANAQQIYGDQRGNIEALEKSVSVYQDALQDYEREGKSLAWAMTQNNLGTALRELGVHDSDTERLIQAVSAFQEALKEFKPEREPLAWATTQNNLGNALAALGERELGTEYLTQAAAAYQEALKGYTEERRPLSWAMTQNNLGSALQALGEREAGPERLTQAVVAFQKALKVYAREREPLDWAMTQNNLGNALQTLGERERGTERLKQAVSAYHEALKERTRARVPLAWAQTQSNLGMALTALGERESGTERLKQAVSAFQGALTEYTKGHLPEDQDRATRGLQSAQQAIAKRSASPTG